MQKKVVRKKTNSKNTSKKLSIKQWISIILAVVIALAFLFFSIYTPKRNKTSSGSNSTFSKTAPSFSKDGSLTIVTSFNSSEINIDIEVVEKEEERMRGLMDRFSLPENAGMFFIFEKDEPRSFWMKNTYISLDIIYINSSKEIVSIQKYTQPLTTLSIPSGKPAKYVLEVNAGFSDRYGINPGDKIKFSY
jgi:hypothetical protein